MDQVYLNRPNVCELLRSKIRDYKKKHPRLNSSQIARKFGIATSTFNRIENNDIRNPSIDQAVKVLRGVGSAEDVADFLRTYYPEIHEGMLDYYVASAQTSILDDSIDSYFRDESIYKMMMLATSNCGLSENYVLQEFGRSGHQKFMKLASKGVLINKNGRFFSSKKDVYLSNISASKVSSFLHEDISKDHRVGIDVKGRSTLIYESVDLKSIKNDLKVLTEDYIHDVRKILKSEKNKGEDLVVLSNLVNCIEQGDMF